MAISNNNNNNKTGSKKKSSSTTAAASKQKPPVTPDWPQFNEEADPFFLKETSGPIELLGTNIGQLSDRYAVVIVTDEDSPGPKNVLLELINNQKDKAKDKILKFYNKVDPENRVTIRAEAWNVSFRPDSKIKVLLSATVESVDGLMTKAEMQLGLPNAAYELGLNPVYLEDKVKRLQSLFEQYQKNVEKMFGKIPKFSFNAEKKKLGKFVDAIKWLLEENALTFDSTGTKSNGIILGVDSAFRPVYVLVNEKESEPNQFQNYLAGNKDCWFPLETGFDAFLRKDGIRHARTINFIKEIQNIKINPPQLPFSVGDFIEKYVYNPPKFDFTSPPPHSPPTPKALHDALKKINEAPTMVTPEELQKQKDLLSDEKIRNQMREKADTQADYVGTNIVSKIQSMGDWIPSVEKTYRDILHKIPIQDLIEAALECLNFRGLELLTISKTFLNKVTAFSGEIRNAIKKIPTVPMSPDFPTADYLADLTKQIAAGILKALMATLLKVVIELLHMLLDFCKECALQNEASGKGRFDGFNFGGLSANSLLQGGTRAFIAGSVGAIKSGAISPSTNPRESFTFMDQVLGETPPKGRFPPLPSAAEQESKLLSETNRFAGNRIASVGNKTVVGDTAKAAGITTSAFDVKTPEQKAQADADAAKKQVGNFLTAASGVLTPGELGNMMLGCGGGREPLDAVRALLKSFPDIPIGSDGVADDDSILEFFNTVGKLAGYNNVLEIVALATENISEDILCLCDPATLAIREKLLSDKGIDDDVLKDLLESQDARDRERLTDLNDILKKDNILEDMPSTFCHYDPWTQEVKPGLVEQNHPKFMHTMDNTLNTCYNFLASTSNVELKAFFPTLTSAPIGNRVIPRTLVRNNRVEFHREFLDLVGKGTYAFGSIIPGARALRSDHNVPAEPMENAEKPPGQTTPQDFTNITWVGAQSEIEAAYGVWYSNDDQEDSNSAIGMSRPFPESERLWEMTNFPGDFLTGDANARGGRFVHGDYYTTTYGYSPVPIVVKERGQAVFAPGYQRSYGNLCGEEDHNESDQKFQINKVGSGLTAVKVFSIEVPNNITDVINMGIAELTQHFANAPNQVAPEDAAGTPFDVTTLDPAAALSSFAQAATSSRWKINYIMPPGEERAARHYQGPIAADPYLFNIGVESIKGSSQSAIFSMAHAPPINPKAWEAMNHRNLHFQPQGRHALREMPWKQEQFFQEVLRQSIAGKGASVYVNGQAVAVWGTRSSTEYLTGFKRDTTSPSLPQASWNSAVDSISEEIYEMGAFNEIWKALFCSFTNQIAQSPYFDLANIGNLDLTPTRRTDDGPCSPHLLDIDAVKQRIKEEYSLIQCVEASFPNVSGLGTNRHNPFEKANLGGIILLILRAHVLEILLRNVQAFYYFRYRSAEDVDPILVRYISTKITQHIMEEFYFEEFESEILDLYNRNFPIDPELGEPTTYDTAINELVKYQIYSVCNRLSRLVDSRGDTSIDTILLEEWIPLKHIQYEPCEPRFAEESGGASSELNYVDPAMIDIALSAGGNLSGPKINNMRGGPGWQPHSLNQLYSGPVGWMFREYRQSFMGDAGAGEKIWSFDQTGATSAIMPRPDPNGGFAWLFGNEDVTKCRSKVGVTRAGGLGSTAPGGRELGALLSSGLAQLVGSNVDMRAIRGDEINKLPFMYGVSDEEKQAFRTIIKFIGGAANTPIAPFEQYRLTRSHGATEDKFFPGFYLKKFFNEIRRGQHNVINFVPGDGFWESLAMQSATDSVANTLTPYQRNRWPAQYGQAVPKSLYLPDNGYLDMTDAWDEAARMGGGYASEQSAQPRNVTHSPFAWCLGKPFANIGLDDSNVWSMDTILDWDNYLVGEFDTMPDDFAFRVETTPTSNRYGKRGYVERVDTDTVYWPPPSPNIRHIGGSDPYAWTTTQGPPRPVDIWTAMINFSESSTDQNWATRMKMIMKGITSLPGDSVDVTSHGWRGVGDDWYEEIKFLNFNRVYENISMQIPQDQEPLTYPDSVRGVLDDGNFPEVPDSIEFRPARFVYPNTPAYASRGMGGGTEMPVEDYSPSGWIVIGTAHIDWIRHDATQLLTTGGGYGDIVDWVDDFWIPILIPDILPRFVTIGTTEVGPFIFSYANAGYDEDNGMRGTEARRRYYGKQNFRGEDMWNYRQNTPYGAYTRQMRMDPWTYRGPARTVTVNPFESFANQASSAGGPYSVLNPAGTRGPAHLQLFSYMENLLHTNTAPEASLMDFDPLSVKLILQWEMKKVQDGSAGLDPNDESDRWWIDRIVARYVDWIEEWDVKVVQNFSKAFDGRLRERNKLMQRINTYPAGRRQMLPSPIKDFESGGLVLEPYIRYESHNDDEFFRDILSNPSVAFEPLIAGSGGHDIVGSDFYRGIVNIDKFQEFVNSLGDPGAYSPVFDDAISQADRDTLEICGGGTLEITPSVVSEDTSTGPKLGHYFKKVHLGLRLSYVAPLTEFGPNESARRSEVEWDIPSTFRVGAWESQAQFNLQDSHYVERVRKQNSYYVREAEHYTHGGLRDVNVIPIAQVETPISLHVTIRNANKIYFKDTSGVDPQTGELLLSKKEIGFFRAFYDSEMGLRKLISDMKNTPDYALMFKYMFSLDRMLAMNNIYGSVHLGSYMNVEEIFNGTKSSLKELFFIFWNSGNWQKAGCKKNNRDFWADFGDGFPVKEMAIQILTAIAQAVVLIYKGFTEMVDPNVQWSKKIIDLIHSLNSLIAASLRLTNQAVSASVATAQGLAELGSSVFASGCEDLPAGCQVSDGPQRPPDSVFDPINENFIPELQTWQVGLPLMFLIWPTPFAPLYWILDNKPEPNWLGSMADWLTDMIHEDKGTAATPPRIPVDECSVDLGLPPPASTAAQQTTYYFGLNNPSLTSLGQPDKFARGLIDLTPQEGEPQIPGAGEEPAPEVGGDEPGVSSLTPIGDAKGAIAAAEIEALLSGAKMGVGLLPKVGDPTTELGLEKALAAVAKFSASPVKAKASIIDPSKLPK